MAAKLTQAYIDAIPQENRNKLGYKLDFESGGVQTHLGAIARAIESWEGEVADVLKLTPPEVASIKTEYPGRLDLQTRAALQKWQDRSGMFATYHYLITSFVSIGKTSYAEAVCRVLGANFDSNTGDTTAVVPTCTAVEPSVQQTTDQVVAAVPDQLVNTDPSPAYVPNSSQLYSDSEVKSQMEHFKDQFLSLQRKVLSELKQKRVEVDVIQDELALLPVDIQEEHCYYIEHAITELEKVRNLLLLFFHLNLYWNFFEFNLLEHVINCNGSTELKERMKKYAEEMEMFKQRTTVAQFKTFWPGKHEVPPHFSRVEVKLEINFNECTLAQLDKFRKELCRKARLLEFVLILFDVKDGSILFTFLLSCQLVPRLVLFCHHHPQFLRSHHVVAVSIDGRNVQKMEELTTASKYCGLETVETLLQFGVDPNTLNQYGWTSLMLASIKGHIKIVQLLITHGADVNIQRHYDGWSALMIASQLGHTHVVDLLLSHQAQVNATLKDGATALNLATQKRHFDVVRTLLTHDANVNMARKNGVTPLLWASQKGYTDIARMLLTHNADVNVKDRKGGATPLIVACQNGHTDVVNDLLDHNADVNIAREDCITPLLWASQKGYTDIAKMLLTRNADVNVKGGKVGRTALMMACLFNHLDIVQQLLQSHADVNAVSEDGFTALMIAAEHGHSHIVKALLEVNADITIANKNTGWTSLFFAAQGGHIGVAEMLIQHGAVVDIKDKMGFTAYDISCANHHPEVSELLKIHSQFREQRKISTEYEHQPHEKYFHQTSY